jgi:hypothetical protein
MFGGNVKGKRTRAKRSHRRETRGSHWTVEGKAGEVLDIGEKRLGHYPRPTPSTLPLLMDHVLLEGQKSPESPEVLNVKVNGVLHPFHHTGHIRESSWGGEGKNKETFYPRYDSEEPIRVALNDTIALPAEGSFHLEEDLSGVPVPKAIPPAVAEAVRARLTPILQERDMPEWRCGCGEVHHPQDTVLAVTMDPEALEHYNNSVEDGPFSLYLQLSGLFGTVGKGGRRGQADSYVSRGAILLLLNEEMERVKGGGA